MTTTDLDVAQAEIARLTLELAAQTRHSAQLLNDLHASEARRQRAEEKLKARETAST